MKGALSFLTWWMAAGWVWVFFLEVTQGSARLYEPNRAILYLEFSLATGVSLFAMGYFVRWAIRLAARAR